MIVLLVLVITTCSSYSHLTIVRGQQSSIYQDNSEYNTEKGYDNDMTSKAVTKKTGRPEWMRFYFARSYLVQKVVIVELWSPASTSGSNVYSIFVLDGEVKTLCGTFTAQEQSKVEDATVQCGGNLPRY